MRSPRPIDADRDAEFERFFRAYHAAVLAYARRRADATVAQDVTAETFAVAWRKWEQLPRDRPLPWLYGVARRTLANNRRSERRQHATAEAVAETFRPGVMSDEPTGVVAAALASLRDDDQDALLLIAWEGLSPQDAAAALGVSYATFRVRTHRARRRLAKALLASGYQPGKTIATEPTNEQVAKEPRYG